MRLEWVLALCAVGAVSGAAPRVTDTTTTKATTATTGTTNNRHRRSSATELFLRIVAERPSNKGYKNVTILPVQLPIQLGGEGGIILPVLVLPVPVYTNAPGSCNANHHEQTPAEKPSEPTTAPEQNPAPFVATRQQFTQIETSSNADQAGPQPQEPEQVKKQPEKPQETIKIKVSPKIVVPTPVVNVPTPHVQPIEQAQEAQPEKPQETVKIHVSPKLDIPVPVVNDVQPIEQVEEVQSEKPHDTVKIQVSPKIVIPTPIVNLPSLHVQPIEQVQVEELQPEKPRGTVTYQDSPKAPIVKLPLRGQPFVQTKQPSHDTAKISHYVSSKIAIPSSVNIAAPHGGLNVNLGAKVGFKVEAQPTPAQPVSHQLEVSTPAPEESIPYSEGRQLFETSEQMIQSFRRQSPVAPQLPAVIPDLDLPNRLPVPKPSSSENAPDILAQSPPRPDFNRTLRLRVDLSAPNSDYTEAYDIQWHAESNTAKTVVEDGSTVIYRAPLADGRVQFLEVQRERSGDKVVRRCTLSPLMPASPADKAFPGLPEFDQFEFTGYTSAEGRSLVERWRRIVAGGPGEGGAAQGESLTFTHDMLIIRDRGLAVPLRYTVVTDSSVLGPGSDSYTHRYDLLTPPTAAVLPNTVEECDLFDELHDDEKDRQRRDVKGFLSKVVSRFDPIREFAGPTRDTRYDSVLTKFKDQFKRKYIDPAEEAVRKNLLIKSSRFIEAGNRLASGFKMAANFLADRLDDEIDHLFGVQPLPEGASEPGLIPFPYSGSQLKEISNKLGDEFDWRPLGAVSPVRFQDTTCSSCWAFAVAGSTEGALFKKTNKLVPLSPQCLVDCGRPYGANGCNGTWPSFAYDYVQNRGLPAWEEYTDYQAKVLECKDKSVPPVTHISGHVNVTANSEPALKVAIKNHAPNVVIVDAKAHSFIFYESGVLKDKRCGENKPKLNHAVLAVGWGTKDGPHFIIKNTWSAKWGEAGYIRIVPDACGVMDRPSYPLIEVPNIDREELRAAAASVEA